MRFGGAEWRRAGEHFVCDSAERVEIGPMVGSGIADDLFGRHIRRRTERRALERDTTLCRRRYGRQLPAQATDPITFEMPKSATTADVCVSRMFSGLMSRCTTSLPCANASARVTSTSVLTVSRMDIGPRASRVRNDTPSTNGITKYGRPSIFVGLENRHDLRMLERGEEGDLAPEAVGGVRTRQLAGEHLDDHAASKRNVIGKVNTADMPPPRSSPESVKRAFTVSSEARKERTGWGCGHAR